MSHKLAFAVIFSLTSLLMSISPATFAEIDAVANPIDFKKLDDSQLGLREDGAGVENGHQLSEFNITDIDGNSYPFSKLYSEQPLVVVFYRGGWCPYCNAQSKELADNYSLFSERGVTPVLISVDKPDSTALLQKTYEIPFPVLSDQDLVAHKEFNVIMKVPEERVERAKSFGLEFSEWSDRDHSSFAVASSFIVDTKGVVQWSTIVSDYSLRQTAEQLAAVIDQWRAQ